MLGFHKWKAPFAALALLAAGTTFARADDPGKLLVIPLYGQETSVWCWDAASLMVIKYFRPSSTLTQCEIATQGTPGQTCCTTPTPAPCVHTGWEMLSANGFTFSTSLTALPFADLVGQIAINKPVMYAVGWTGGGGHMMVADGWFVFANVNFVQVNNPWPPNVGTQEFQTYDYWVGGPWYDHITWANFYNIVDTQKPKFTFKIPNFKIARRWPPIPQPDPERFRLPINPEIPRLALERLDQFRKAPPEIARRLGFLSSQEAGRATLGTPLREFVVPAEALVEYSPNRPAASLLTGGESFFYPVVAGNELRSSIRIAPGREGKPEVIAIGDAGSASHLNRLEGIGPSLRQRSDVGLPAVRVPALGLLFVARFQGKALEIAPIFDVPTLGLKAGRFEDAGQVFIRLGPFLKNNLKGVM